MPVIRGQTIEILFSAEKIASRNGELAQEIQKSVPKDLLIISILKGSFVFAADLIRAIHSVGIEPEVEFISISSYGAGETPGGPVVLRDVESDVAGKDVLLVDDILESGGTLQFVHELMIKRGALRIQTAILLDKSMQREISVTPDFIGFECPDRFVVGYGMDSGHAFRELPYVGAVVKTD